MPVIEFETARTVIYPWLCDSMGHLATQHYMKVFDDASYQLLGRLGYFPREAAQSGVGWADVNHTINYTREVLAGDLVVVFSSVRAVGGKSLTYRSRLLRLSSEPVECAVLNGVMVHFDLHRRKAIELPEKLRASAMAGLEPADDAQPSVASGGAFA